MPAPRLTDAMLDTARSLIASGATLSQAAAAIDCSRSALRYHGITADPGHSARQSAQNARLLRKRWDRERILAAMDAWAQLYGQPPAAADWNPAQARAQGRPDRAERHAGGAWPFYSTVCGYHGSWSAAISAWRVRQGGMVPVYGEDGQGRPGAYAMRRGHILRDQ